MLSKKAIICRNIEKKYALYKKPEDRLKQLLFGSIFRKVKFFQEHYALRNISFAIEKGSTTGIVGMNGAGKTTLLKTIVGSTSVSSGTIEVNGNVSAILSLGTGFNPEFTGIENIKYRASLLGMDSKELAHKLQKIIDFTDIGDFIYQPLKLYSTGMVARLGFAIAVHFDPDILIIDEALSVGDEAFARKCFARLETLKAKKVTILFVSHSASAVVELCDNAILLHHGECLFQGEPNMVIKLYRKLLNTNQDQQKNIINEIKNFVGADKLAKLGRADKKDKSDDKIVDLPKDTIDKKDKYKDCPDIVNKINDKNDKEEQYYDSKFISESVVTYPVQGACISNLRLENTKKEKINIFSSNIFAYFCYDLECLENISKYKVGMFLKTLSGYELYGKYYELSNAKKDDKFIIRFPIKFTLTAGVYFFNAGIVGQVNPLTDEKYLHRILDGFIFRVLPSSKNLTGVIDISAGKMQFDKIT